ncbi:MAG: hypothetical protein AB1633_03235 [Elusimicrobiota bacterium]
MAIIAIPRILREKLTDDGAEALVEVINKSDEKSKEDVLDFVGERFERRLTEVESGLRIEINRVEEKFERQLTEVASGLKIEINRETSVLKTEINRIEKQLSDTKADMIKWTFAFIFGQFWAILGALYIFFK